MAEHQSELRGQGEFGDTAEAANPDWSGSTGSVMHEREAELRTAAQAIDTLCCEFRASGTQIGELVLYSAPAGLGKTTVLTQVRRLAGLRDCTILFARGGEQQRNEPFQVLRQLLQPVLGALTAPEREKVFGRWHDVVARATGLVPPDGSLDPLDPQGIRDGLDYVLTQLASCRAPLVLIIDDLHWADLESLAWLSAFAVRARELPVLLVLARREEFPDEAEPFQQAIAAHASRRHNLRDLQPASVAAMVRDCLGPDAEDAFCRQFWAVTNGNPYDTVALLREVIEQALDPVDENAPALKELSAEARGMTRKHWLAKLGPSTLRFAWAASMLGTDIRPELAAGICTQGPATAAESINELRRHRVLTSTPNGRLEFVHPLILTSIYQSMPPGARTGMHGVAAAEIENAGLGLLAASRHLIETFPEGDYATVRKLRMAAAEHLAIGAPEAAQRCLQRALREPPNEEDRAEVLYELGCSALLTDPATTVNQLRLALAEEKGLSQELRVDATFRLSEALANSGELTAAAEVCQQEADRTPPGPGKLRLQAAALLWAAFQTQEADGLDCSQRLEELSRSLTGRETAERAVLAMRAWDLTLRGAPADEALGLVAQILDGDRLPQGLGWTGTTWGFELPSLIGLSCIYTDQLALAEKLFSDAILEFEVAGWSGGHLGFAYFLMGLVRFRRGLLAEAEDFLRRGLRLAERIAPGIPLQWDTVGVLIDTLLAQGRSDEAWDLAQKYHFGPPYHPTVMVLPDAPTLYGKLLLARGDRAGAAIALTEAGAKLDVRGWRNTVWAPWAGHLALAVAPGDPERAHELADEAIRRAREFGTESAVGSTLRLCAAMYDGQRAVDLLEEAVRRLGRSPAAYEYASALIDLGSALHNVGRLAEAAEYLRQGLELAEHCGAGSLVTRAYGLLATLGADTGQDKEEIGKSW